jgi:hypothetical protein
VLLTAPHFKGGLRLSIVHFAFIWPVAILLDSALTSLLHFKDKICFAIGSADLPKRGFLVGITIITIPFH